MRHSQIVAALIGLCLFGTSQAETPFSCTIARNGKVVTLQDQGSKVYYSYGKKGMPPEMAIAVPKPDVEIYAWQGVGRNHTYSVKIPNGEHSYTVFTSLDTHTQTIESGIWVQKGDKLLATLICHPKSVRGDLEGYVLSLKPIAKTAD